MRIVSYLTATTTFEVAWEEIRPLAGVPFLLTVEALKARYQFQGVGQSMTAAQQGLMTPHLQSGMLPAEAGNIQIGQIDFQANGIVITSASTEQTLKIFDNLFAFLHGTLGFRKPPENRNRSYSSTIIIDMGPILEKIFVRWENISSFIQSHSTDGMQILPFGVKFMAIRGNEVIADRQFVFERRMPAPSGENWMFSQGPFDTEVHVKLLEKIEAEFKT